MNLRDAWFTMPGLDFVAHVKRLAHLRDSALRRHLLGDEAEWGPDEENRALLLEVQAYQLQLDWVDRTTDPDDPAVKREREQARRAGLKPPKRPIVPPAAHRPGGMAEQRLQAYIDELTSRASPTVKQLVTLDEFDRLIGLP